MAGDAGPDSSVTMYGFASLPETAAEWYAHCPERGAYDLDRARTAGRGDRRAVQWVHCAADGTGQPVRD
eukprot:5248886-Lingulodinium_polyedra.AAC.1